MGAVLRGIRGGAAVNGGASGTPPPTGALIDGAEDAILGDYLQPVYRINAAVPCKKRGNAVRYIYWKILYF